MAGKIEKLATKQHGAVSREQLIRLGLTRHQIDRLIKRGWLIPLYRGVFAVGHTDLGNEGRWMAAVLFAGDGAVLSHLAAAGLWGIAPRGPTAYVTVPKYRKDKDGVTFHTSRLPFDEITVHDGIPVTTPHRTIFDLASMRRRESVERSMNECDYLRLPDTLGLPALLERHPRAKGAGLIRTILAAGVIPRMESALEEEFVAYLRARRVPLPEMNAEIEWAPGRFYKPDCVWRDAKLIVELHGYQAHTTRTRFHGDPLRARRLRTLGWEVWPVTGQHLDDELEAQLRARLCR